MQTWIKHDRPIRHDHQKQSDRMSRSIKTHSNKLNLTNTDMKLFINNPARLVHFLWPWPALVAWIEPSKTIFSLDQCLYSTLGLLLLVPFLLLLNLILPQDYQEQYGHNWNVWRPSQTAMKPSRTCHLHKLALLEWPSPFHGIMSLFMLHFKRNSTGILWHLFGCLWLKLPFIHNESSRNRPFARWCPSTTKTRINFIFTLIFKFGKSWRILVVTVKWCHRAN